MLPVLRRLAAIALLAFPAAAGAVGLPVPAQWPAGMVESLRAETDDPQGALEPARQRAAAATGVDRVWALLAVARLESSLELDDAVDQSLAQAEAELGRQPAADPQAALWLQVARLRQAAFTRSGTAELGAIVAFRQAHATLPGPLQCELLDVETWLLPILRSLDEAWRAADELDACGTAIGGAMYRSQAALTRGKIAAAVRSGPDAAQRVVEHFQQAEAQAGDARFLRSLVSFAAGAALAGMKHPQEALQAMRRALDSSRSLGDAAGVAAALTEIAALDLDLGRPADALKVLDEAAGHLKGLGEGGSARVLRVHTLRLQAAARLHRPELAALVARAAQIDLSHSSTPERRDLVLARAEALAALARHAEAYEAMRQARDLDAEIQRGARDAQVLQLQARYDTARRDAEIASLRFKEESSRLTLQAREATERGLWTALAATGLALLAAGVLGWRSWQRRRELAVLALRDELTGLPNRRAIEAYARAQLGQAQRLGLPFSLALVDLDHFKQVNDRWGHDVGDQVLKAFAAAMPGVLRSPDRVGRWGGEEFLLVLPGTTANEMGGVFARLLTAFATADVPGLPSPHGLTFSLGGAGADAGADYEGLLKQADERLFAAKAAGRATWR